MLRFFYNVNKLLYFFLSLGLIYLKNLIKVKKIRKNTIRLWQ